MSDNLPQTAIDLASCEREPIHIPGSIQSHGVLIGLEQGTLRIIQVSANCAQIFKQPPEQLLGQPAQALLGPIIPELQRILTEQPPSFGPMFLSSVQLGPTAQACEVVVHISDDVIVIEIERALANDDHPARLYRQLRETLNRLQHHQTLYHLAAGLSAEVAQLTGYDRVMIYRFLGDYSGEVIGEHRRQHLESFLGLRYPASDIPPQARALYTRNLLRVIPDIEYTPQPILPTLNPLNGQPLDLSLAVLRSVSPVHIEYLRNMGVHATLAISLLDNGKLWGMIVGHHYSGPHLVPYDLRTLCELLGQMSIGMLRAREDAEDAHLIQHAHLIIDQISIQLSSSSDWQPALMHGEATMRDIFPCGGAAIVSGTQCSVIGETPPHWFITDLCAWLATQTPASLQVYEQLGAVYPPAREYTDVVSGLLAVAITANDNYLLWFRPELPRIVTWGGNPNKPVELSAFGNRLSPRRSFAAWREEVRGSSTPWKRAEIELAQRLHNAVTAVVIRKTSELARLNQDLERSNAELDAFAYIASHDLKEPLRGIHNYAGFLLEDYQTKLDSEGVAQIQTILRLSQRMESLIESLLYYSRVGRVDLALELVDLDYALDQTLELLHTQILETGVTIIRPRPLPHIRCDHARIGDVLSNLIGNAIRYNTNKPAWVEIGYLEEFGAPTVFYVRDNGIGIAPHNHEAVFRMFRRLNGRNSFGEGSGVGLTIVKKIIERHQGKIWLESQLGKGTTFYFTLEP